MQNIITIGYAVIHMTKFNNMISSTMFKWYENFTHKSPMPDIMTRAARSVKDGMFFLCGLLTDFTFP